MRKIWFVYLKKSISLRTMSYEAITKEFFDNLDCSLQSRKTISHMKIVTVKTHMCLSWGPPTYCKVVKCLSFINLLTS